MNFFNKLRPLADLVAGDKGNLDTIIKTVNTVISAFLGLLTAGVTILAIFIAYKFFTADDDTKRKNAKNQLIYAIIGIVALVALLVLTPNVVTWIKSSVQG